MIKSKFREDIQVLEVVYEGSISSEDILKHVAFISESKKLPGKLKILTDARHASYNFDVETVSKLIDFLKQIMQNYESIKDAFIHSKPKETAYSVMMGLNHDHKNYFHNIFSTKEAALKWLE